jgi:hypothetical protein
MFYLTRSLDDVVKAYRLIRFIAFQTMDTPHGHRVPPHDIPPNVANIHRLQQVSTLDNRKNVINWMVEDEVLHGFNGLYGRTIHTFSENFRG